MNVERYGSGAEAFLALHGWGGDHRDFVALAARLPADASLYSVDLPGYGLSPPPRAWRIEEVVASLVKVLEERGLRRVTAIGFCSGAVLALLLAQQAAQRVARAVLIDPLAFVPWYFRLFLSPGFGVWAYRTTFATGWGRALTTAVLRRRQRTDDDFMAAFARVDHEVALRWLRMLRDLGPVRRFEGMSLPVDIAYGENTFAAVQASVSEYVRVLPQARTHVLKNAGHLPLVRAARQIAAILWGDAERRG